MTITSLYELKLKALLHARYNDSTASIMLRVADSVSTYRFQLLQSSQYEYSCFTHTRFRLT